MKPWCTSVCKRTAAVVIHALSQPALLQQATNINFHIGGLCDMKTGKYLAAVILHCKYYMRAHHLVMHLVLLDMPVLYMMVFTASFDGNWFYLLVIFLYNPPSAPPPSSAATSTFSFRAIQTFLNSTQLLSRTRDCFKGTAEERNKQGTGWSYEEQKRMEWKAGHGGLTTDLRLQTALKSMQPPTTHTQTHTHTHTGTLRFKVKWWYMDFYVWENTSHPSLSDTSMLS